MKQRKKPKIFRTLIRRDHISNKAVRKKSKTQSAGKERKRQPPFFFGP